MFAIRLEKELEEQIDLLAKAKGSNRNTTSLPRPPIHNLVRLARKLLSTQQRLAPTAIIAYNAINDCSTEEIMASLTIRNLDNNLKAQLRQRAARHGRSMEAEARTILAQTLSAPACEQDLAVVIHQRFAALDADSLPIPPRQAVRNPPELGE